MLKKFFVLTIFIAMHNVVIASQKVTAQIQVKKEIKKYSFEGFEFGDHLSKEDNNDNLKRLIEKRKEHLSIPCCNVTFSWPDFLNHFKSIHNSHNNNYDCPYENCRETFCYHESARNHYIIHYALNLFTCACCNKPYETQSGLRKHFWTCMKKHGLPKKNNNTLTQEIIDTDLENDNALTNQNTVNHFFLEGYEFGDHISPKQHEFNFQRLLAARKRKITIPYKNNMLSWAAFRNCFMQDNAHKSTFPCINVDCSIVNSNIEKALIHHAHDHNQELFACPKCKRQYSSRNYLGTHFKQCLKLRNLNNPQSDGETTMTMDGQNTRIDLGAIINESIEELRHISGSNTNIM